jgi:hypothetical protein
MCTREMRFLEKNKKNKYRKKLQKVKKNLRKVLDRHGVRFKTPKEKVRAFGLRAFVFLGLLFLEHAARTAAYYNRIRMRPARHAEDR